MTELSLARAFPTAKDSDWRALVTAALKGAPLASLRSATYDGIAIEPLYPRATDAKVIPGRISGEPWGVVQRADLPDAKTANSQVLDDLSNGANGLSLVFPGSVGDYGYALTPTPDALAETLTGVQLDAGIAVELNLGPNCKETALMLANLVQRQGISPANVNIRFGFDPLGVLAGNGWNAMPWPAMEPIFAALIADLKSQGFQGPFAVGDGRPVHAAGGSEAEELAFALSTALAYLRAMESGGISLDDARRHIFFRLAADQDQFLTIAKFRALRKLWARIEEACGLAPRPAFVAAETAWRMMTKRDPHGNIVRGTIAALAAALGGADAVTVLPYSAALGAPEAHARRIARNTQTILIEESNLYRVADPAAGSGAIEALTDAVSTKAWALFQDIERAGGAGKALTLIRDAVAKIREERQRNAARRKDAMVGTSDFPDLGEEARCGARRRASTDRYRSETHQGGVAADASCRAVRSFARQERRLSREPRDASEGVSRLPRTARRFQYPRELRQELVRGRRHRGGRRERNHGRRRGRLQGIWRKARLSLLLRQDLCERGTRCRQGAGGSGSHPCLSRRQAPRRRRGTASGRDRHVPLSRL